MKSRGKDFCLESYILIKSISCFCDSMAVELKSLTVNNYSDTFKDSIKLLDSVMKKITEFIEKWEDDDEQICHTLNGIKDYYKFYEGTLSNSSPSAFRRDSKYIIESLITSKLVLECKLNRVKCGV